MHEKQQHGHSEEGYRYPQPLQQSSLTGRHSTDVMRTDASPTTSQRDPWLEAELSSPLVR
jgi:hypothetical protein